ncbi:ATP-binding protein [Micromonospora yasonensis]|uniref:ATP-binding protein n=1 Tax=Micromonospora yasonensis TaxID=1128667 RepID=UPI00222F1A5E|nr:ATP-binding protein [Micromonospora yasonensis]MCW3845199.1 ATP-binding protein [Micromonospora yasonensis]
MAYPDLPLNLPGWQHQTGVPEASDPDQPFDEGSLSGMRATLTAHLAALGAAPTRIEQLLIVAGELATNAIRHGGGVGWLRLWRDHNSLHLQVTDHGPGMADTTAGAAPPDRTALGGRGMWICRQLVPDLGITTGPDGTTIVAVIDLGD